MPFESTQPDSEYYAPFQALKDHLTNEVVPSIVKAVPALSRQRMHGDYDREFKAKDGDSHNLFRAWAGGSVHWLTHLDITAPQLYVMRLDGWLTSPPTSTSTSTSPPTSTTTSSTTSQSTSTSTSSSFNTAPHLFSEIALMRTDPGEGRDNMFFFMDLPPRVDLRRHPHYLSRYYDAIVLPFDDNNNNNNNNKATFTRRDTCRYIGSPATAYYSFRGSEEAIRTIKEAVAEYVRLWCAFVTDTPDSSGDDGDEVVDMKAVLACDEALKAYLHRNPLKQKFIGEHFGEDMLPLIIACMDGSARDG